MSFVLTSGENPADSEPFRAFPPSRNSSVDHSPNPGYSPELDPRLWELLPWPPELSVWPSDLALQRLTDPERWFTTLPAGNHVLVFLLDFRPMIDPFSDEDDGTRWDALLGAIRLRHPVKTISRKSLLHTKDGTVMLCQPNTDAPSFLAARSRLAHRSGYPSHEFEALLQHSKVVGPTIWPAIMSTRYARAPIPSIALGIGLSGELPNPRDIYDLSVRDMNPPYIRRLRVGEGASD